jgi:phosphate transport system substrate-binding protein
MLNRFCRYIAQFCFSASVVGALISVLTLTGLSTASWAAPDAKKLVLTGSSTVAPVAAEIAKRFESLNPGIRVDVQSGGSGRGVSDARDGLADIGLVSRNLNPEESDLTQFKIAQDGITVIVHSTNPVKVLSADQIKAIYTGKIKNWKDLGGKDAPITVVNKAEGRSTLELFLKYFGLKNSDIKPQIVIGDNVQGIKTVSGNPNAIGYVSIGAAEAEAKQGATLKLLPMDGIVASVATVKNGQFPISRPLMLVTKGAPVGLKKQFIEFAQSKKVSDLVEGQYFVPATK